MNLLADEGVDGPVVEQLRQDGHEVLYVAEMEPGIADEEILQKANEQRSLLVTADKDFGEMVFHQNLLSTREIKWGQVLQSSNVEEVRGSC